MNNTDGLPKNATYFAKQSGRYFMVVDNRGRKVKGINDRFDMAQGAIRFMTERGFSCSQW